jgi:hypothetical protein
VAGVNTASGKREELRDAEARKCRGVRTEVVRLIVVDLALGSHEPIGAGSVLGGDAARAVEIRHGDSGFWGMRDGVARLIYVPVVGRH